MPLADFTSGDLILTSEQADELKALGQLQEIYAPDRSSMRGNAALLWVGIVVGLLFLGSPLLSSLSDKPVRPRDPKTEAELTLGKFVAPPMGIVFLVWCGWRLRQLAEGRRVQILEFADGLARFDGQSLKCCRWEDIHTVELSTYSYSANHIHVGSTTVISLGLADGGQLVIDTSKEHLARMESLYRRISQETTSCLLPGTFAAIEEGQTVSFGQLAVSRRGLHYKGDQLLDWSMVENISASPQLCIRKKNGSWLDYWSRWSRRGFRVANLELFLLLTQHYLQQHRLDRV